MTIYIISEKMGSWGSGIILHLAKLAFKQPVEFTNNPDKAHLIIRSCGGGEPEVTKPLPYVTFMGEAYPPNNYRSYPQLFELSMKTGEFNVPYLVSVYFELQSLIGTKFDKNDLRLDKNQTRPFMLAYCASNPKPMRDHLFRLIQKHEPTAHGIGRCCGTPGYQVGEHATWRENWQHYRKYRFTIAMENLAAPNYVTEKLLNAILAGSIPIYYGDPEWVKRVFNEKAIIFVQDFPSLEACAQYVLAVDRNPSWLAQYQNQPVFVKDWSWFTEDESEINDDYKKMIAILRANIL